MPSKLAEPQTKVCYRLNTKDVELLGAAYGPGAVNKVIRTLVERHCDAVRERLAGLRA